EDADWLASLLRGRADIGQLLVALFERAVSRVDTEHTRPGVDQLGELFDAAAGRADGHDDFGTGSVGGGRTCHQGSGFLVQCRTAEVPPSIYCRCTFSVSA